MNYDIRDLSVVVDGTTDNAVALDAAFEKSRIDRIPLQIPSGIISTSQQPDRAYVTLENGDNFVLSGQGPHISVIEASEVPGRFSRLIEVSVKAGHTADLISISGLSTNMDGTNVAQPETSNLEQAHSISITPTQTSLLKRLIVRDIELRDKVGGGLVLSSGNIDNAHIENVHGVGEGYTAQGSRGDFENQASVGNLVAINCSGKYMQTEPNIHTPFHDRPKSKYIGCSWGIWDLCGYRDAHDAQLTILNSCEGGENFWFRNTQFDVDASRLRTTGSVDWRSCRGKVRNSTITVGVDAEENKFLPLRVGTVSAGGPVTGTFVDFEGVDFISDDTFDEATSGCAVSAVGVLREENLGKFRASFKNCRFSERFGESVFAYRCGTWEFINTSLSSKVGSSAITCGISLGMLNKVLIDNCDLSNVKGDLLNVLGQGVGLEIEFRGRMDYEKFSVKGRPPTEYEDKVINNAVWLSDSEPNGAGIKGMHVQLRNPISGLPFAWVCTVSSSNSAAWEPILSVQSEGL
jgi:hypothetical protein